MAAGGVVVSNPVLAAADLMNAGTGAPKQDYAFVLHLAADKEAGAFLCGQARTGVMTFVDFAHPAVCPTCLRRMIPAKDRRAPYQGFVVEK